MISPLLLALIAAAEPVPTPRVTGAVMAPAFLPAGSNALYGFVGAPELGVGYRQGFGTVEFEARGLFNVFEVSAIGEVGLKLGVHEDAKLRLAPVLALGLEFNSGARYFDRFNFAFVGLRPRVGFNASWAFSDTISGVAQVDVPWSIGLSSSGFQVTPLAGAGAEFHLGGSITFLVSAHLGFDATREPLGVTQFRPAWAARLGVGYRLF